MLHSGSFRGKKLLSQRRKCAIIVYFSSILLLKCCYLGGAASLGLEGFIITLVWEQSVSVFSHKRAHDTFRKKANVQQLPSEVMSNNTSQSGDDIGPNRNVKRNPSVRESPILGSMFSLLENDLDFFLCVCMSACVCVCLYMYSRSWWVRTRMEREWWLTSQLMTNPYPACNSTPAVRPTYTHTHSTHTLSQEHSCKLGSHKKQKRDHTFLSYVAASSCLISWALALTSHPNLSIEGTFIHSFIHVFHNHAAAKLTSTDDTSTSHSLCSCCN